jgi:hypothetical protein
MTDRPTTPEPTPHHHFDPDTVSPHTGYPQFLRRFAPVRTRTFHSAAYYDSFHSIYSSKYPIRYFFYQRFPAVVRRCYTALKETVWWIRYRTTNRYHVVDTGLSPGYHDPGEVLLYASFAVLERHMSDEHINLDWAGSGLQEVENEVNNLWAWWLTRRLLYVDMPALRLVSGDGDPVQVTALTPYQEEDKIMLARLVALYTYF